MLTRRRHRRLLRSAAVGGRVEYELRRTRHLRHLCVTIHDRDDMVRNRILYKASKT